jgi:hypothetical protein
MEQTRRCLLLVSSCALDLEIADLLYRAVPASISCGSRGILWERPVVGRASCAAPTVDSGVRRLQMEDGREGATSCAEHGQDDRRELRLRLRRPGGDRRAAREARAAQTATASGIPDGFLGACLSEPASSAAAESGSQATR